MGMGLGLGLSPALHEGVGVATFPTSGPVMVVTLDGDSQALGGQDDPQNLSVTGFVADAGMFVWTGSALVQPSPDLDYAVESGAMGMWGGLQTGRWSQDARLFMLLRAAYPTLPIAMFKYAFGGSTAADYGTPSNCWDPDSVGSRYNLAKAEYEEFHAALVSAGYTPEVVAGFWQLGQNDGAQATAGTVVKPVLRKIVNGQRSTWSGFTATTPLIFGRPMGAGTYINDVKPLIPDLAIELEDVNWVETAAYPNSSSHWTAAGLTSWANDAWALVATPETDEAKVIRSLGTDLFDWLDAGFGITITGSGVSSWAYRKGTAVPLAQGTDASRPTYSLTDFAGGPSLTFDGSNDQLFTSDPTGLPTGTTTSWTWAVVQQDALAADATSRTVFTTTSGGNDNNSRKLLRSSAGVTNRAQTRSGAGASFNFATDAAVDLTGKHVMLGKHEAAAVLTKVDALGSATAAITLNTATPTVVVAGSAAGSQYWNGKVRDILNSKPLSASREASMFTFLGRRGGLTI